MSPSRRRATARCAASHLAHLAVRTARVPCRVPHSCPVAVGRDVPIAPPRHGAVRGFAPRAPRRAHRSCPAPVPRCGRARCPHRAAAPRRGAQLGKEHTLRVLPGRLRAPTSPAGAPGPRRARRRIAPTRGVPRDRSPSPPHRAPRAPRPPLAPPPYFHIDNQMPLCETQWYENKYHSCIHSRIFSLCHFRLPIRYLRQHIHRFLRPSANEHHVWHHHRHAGCQG